MPRGKAKTKKKKKTKKKEQAATAAKGLPSVADTAAKASAFDAVVEKNKQVKHLKSAWLIAKDKSLGCKKKYDEANGELQDMIDMYSKDLPLFDGEEPQNPDDKPDEQRFEAVGVNAEEEEQAEQPDDDDFLSSPKEEATEEDDADFL